MKLKEYASRVYSKIESASSTREVERIFNRAIIYLRNKKFSENQIKDFKYYLRNQTLSLKDAQQSKQTIQNQRKAIDLLKKDKKK